MMTGLRQRPTGRRSQSCLGELKRGFKQRIIDKSALAKQRSAELLLGLHCPQWRTQHRAGEPRPRFWTFASFSHVGVASGAPGV